MEECHFIDVACRLFLRSPVTLCFTVSDYSMLTHPCLVSDGRLLSDDGGRAGLQSPLVCVSSE